MVVGGWGVEREGDGREVVKGDGWGGGLDAFDVGGGGARVEGGLGEENGNGEGRVQLEKTLSELYHSNQMAYSWRWIEHYCLLHFSLLLF